MSYLKLIRSAPDGPAKNAAVRGKLYEVTYDIATNTEHLRFLCPSLENNDYLIPPLIYPLSVTFSPKFLRPLPLVNQVPRTIPASPASPFERGPGGVASYRLGIRFHVGSRPEHSRGCILIPREAEKQLCELILAEKETRLDIVEPSKP